MPKKPNSQFEKRQKELERKARKEEKAQRRRDRGPDADETPTTDTVAEQRTDA